jgi:hypothetical protein
MLKNDVIRLVKTLSTNEKRHLKLFCKKQSGHRAYLLLFDLIDQTKLKDMDKLELKFHELLPDACFEITAKYLLKVITDSLIQARAEKDILFHQFQSFLRAKVLFDRSLIDEGFKELNRVKKLSSYSQNHFIEYLAYREELNILSTLNFPGMKEDSMIEKQMKARNILKALLQIHEHHSLYELLKCRLIYTGKSLSENEKRQLNDLLLTELSLVTSKVSHNFESKKMHLLFQSYFFTSISDYRSALKTFSELNELFESNLEKLENPPNDYLSSLEGILDSLRTIRGYEEMPFYIDKIGVLINAKYSDQFNLQANKTAISFQLNYLACSGKFKEALSLINKQDGVLLKEASIVDYEKHGELLFYIGLTHFALGEWEKTNKYVNKITLIGKSNYHSTIFKAAKLLGLLAHYELGDLELLQYQVRSYKRASLYKGEILKIEKLIFKIIMLNPNNNSIVKNKLIWKKLHAIVNIISSDKYEMQVLKYFDFIKWLEAKFNSSRASLNKNKHSEDLNSLKLEAT